MKQVRVTQGARFPRAAGNSSECPPPGNAADDTVCLDLGKCKDGKCVPFCEREQRLESCACNGECVSKAGGAEVALACQPDPALGGPAGSGQQRTVCM